MKYQVLRCKRGWYWRIVYSNGQVAAHSEPYTRKRDAKKAAAAVQRQSMYCRLEV